MLKRFDFGKSLNRQVEAYKRLNPQQQQKRRPALLKNLEDYARRYLEEVINPNAANPGQLKSGAENLVEAAAVLDDTRVAFDTFSDMVARSRKVPVVPGLAGLVDRMLELESDSRDNRLALLNWRITTGNMRPERHLSYLSERASLTNEVSHWKDFAWGLSQMISKGTVKQGDDLAVRSLETLIDNRQSLGDKAVEVTLMMAEAQILRKNDRLAEDMLVEIIAEGRSVGDDFFQLANSLLDHRPQCCWELHKIVMDNSVKEYRNGRIGWNVFSERLERSHQHPVEIANYLTNHKEMVRDEKLAVYTLKRIVKLDSELIKDKIGNWFRAFQQAKQQPPSAANEFLQIAAGKVTNIDFPELPDHVIPDSRPTPDASVNGSGTVEAARLELDQEGIIDTAGQPGPEVEEFDDSPEEAGSYDDDESIESGESGNEEDVLDDYGDHADSGEELGEDSSGLDAGTEVDEPESGDDTEEPQDGVAEDLQHVAAVVSADFDIDHLIESLADCERPNQVSAVLDKQVNPDNQSVNELHAISRTIATSGLAPWLVEESHLWFAEQMYLKDDGTACAIELRSIRVPDEDHANRLRQRIERMFTDFDSHPEIAAHIARLSLKTGDYQAALARATSLPEGSEERRNLLKSIEQWINSQDEIPPEMLFSLANAQRLSSDDPLAGFEAATAASLLDLNNGNIQQGYSIWVESINPRDVHMQRARQASYLTIEKGHTELLPIALDEIDALDNYLDEEISREPIRWLDDLRPLLDDLGEDDPARNRMRWTRIYLNLTQRIGNHQQFEQVLQHAASLIAPEATMDLINEYGEKLPAGVRFTVRYRSLVHAGKWQEAISLFDSPDEFIVNDSMTIEQICSELPDEALLPATEKLLGAFGSRGDSDACLGLIKSMSERFESGGLGLDSNPPLKSLLDESLMDLCREEFEPALRYRLQTNRDMGDLENVARDLLALARGRDEKALSELEETFFLMIKAPEQSTTVIEIAEVLANAYSAESPDKAIAILTAAGNKNENPEWALKQISELNLVPEDVDGLVRLGDLAVENGKLDEGITIAGHLLDRNAPLEARELATRLVSVNEGSPEAMITLVRTLLVPPGRDLKQATIRLMKLRQQFQQKEIHANEALRPLRMYAAEQLADCSDQSDCMRFNLALAAISGDQERATALVREINANGDEGSPELLELFDQLALVDTDLPSAIEVSWGRALFNAGRIDEALDRLAGLRDAVGEYPEYIQLLEEIKEKAEGPGASMQLGEAYLRVHLWQRSAEEYAAALDKDPSLAEPILTQLRHHHALVPNPMKYPLHLLALKAVAHSERVSDWGWAVSALNWLVPRWSAEELYELAKDLYRNYPNVEIEEDDLPQLLLHLYRLANKVGNRGDAINYFNEARKLAGGMNEELIGALRELDLADLPEDEDLLFKIRMFQLESAMVEDDEDRVVEFAGLLAQTGAEGREQAVSILGEYQQKSGDSLPVIVARLKLIDLASAEGRTMFVNELLNALQGNLPKQHVRSLISIVLDLVHESPDSPELIELLLQLFGKLGDQARAWQLSMLYVEGDEAPAPTALSVVADLAGDRYAIGQQLARVEILTLRGDFEEAAAALEAVDIASIGERSGLAVNLAEMLLTTPQQARARTWLIEWYRANGRMDLAADHLVWAYATADPQPFDWLVAEKSGDLKYRYGMLLERMGRKDEAFSTYNEALAAGPQDKLARAALNARLSMIHQDANELEQALEFTRAAHELLPERESLAQRTTELVRDINRKRIDETRSEPDNAQRTLRIAELALQNGDVEEAINELQSGIGRGQVAPEVYLVLAECFNLSGDYNIARRAFAELLRNDKLDDADPELRLRTLYGLAQVEENLNNREEAIRNLEQILVLRQNYRDSRQRLDALYNQTGSSPADATAPAPAAQGTKDKSRMINELDEILSMLGDDDDDEQN
ncbi:MAG: tetratricopeptide repeat protein [Planctomycetales bacterium]|nr:MAG: tetratricopeptide repeat protein [Planctomycetales bacterium]